jgi:hypothetical protein
MQREANRGAAMDVGGWLRGLGLEEYEAAFRENKIDDAVLPSLTAEDLKELGVGFVGHRRKLLDAIAALRAEASGIPPLSDTPLSNNKAANNSAERRQVTVMFSDLVGSTALSAQQSSTSSMRYWRRPRRPGRTRRSWPRCCRFPTTNATLLSTLLLNSAGRRR